MKYYCTICSKEKRNDKELLPAIERYLSPRIKNIYQRASSEKVKFLIFSGEYGFIHPYSLIPYYDHLLLEEEIEAFLPLLKEQNLFWEITELVCFMEKEETSGWGAYYTILKRFAKEKDIKISFNFSKR
jgi:hypothetical protein